MIVEDRLFFADPSTFNDPLDSKPSFEVDIILDDLRKLLSALIQRRINKDLSIAVNMLLGKDTIMPALVDLRSNQETNNIINNIKYRSTEPNSDLKDLLQIKTREELLGSYERGIVSFSSRAVCPLLWSHYGDQHKGICVGYSAPQGVRLEQVTYGGERSVKASSVLKMMNGDDQAKTLVDKAVLLKKAYRWNYEKEWRLIGIQGSHYSPLELEEVIFGLRCPLAVTFTVAKALEGRERKVKLYVIREKAGTFILEKRAFNVEEMMAELHNRAVSVFDDAAI